MNFLGCDSIITLDLTINYSSSSNITEFVCDSFTVNTETFYTTDTYYQTLVNSEGCDSTITLNLTITETPQQPVIQQSGNTLASNITANTYKWYLNGSEITGANSQFYTANQNGFYQVEALNSNDCSNISEMYNFTYTSILDIEFADINVYPNPTNSFINIESTDITITDISISDITGKIIYKSEIDNKSLIRIDISEYKTGLYFLKISSNSGNKTIKIQKK